MILAPKGHPLASQESISFKDLGEETLFIPASRDFPTQYSAIQPVSSRVPKLNVRASLNSRHDAIALTEAGRGFSMVRSMVLKGLPLDSLKILTLDELDLTFDICAVWKKDRLDSTLTGCIEILKELTESA